MDKDELKKLLASITESETELKALHKAKTLPHDKRVITLRNTICNLYLNYILTYPDDTLDRNWLGHLWKYCFYIWIEYYRKAMSKEVNNNKIRGNFLQFLNQSIQYYTLLTNRIQEHLKTNANHVVVFLNKCFITIGDLHRYLQVANQSGKKTFTDAEKYYNKAIDIDCTNGAAYNQLAVLGQYVNKDIVAIYYYIRSLTAKNIFTSKSDKNINNVYLFYQLNNEKYNKKILNDSNDSNDNNVIMNSKERSKLLKQFLSSFIYLNGTIYLKIRKIETFNNMNHNAVVKDKNKTKLITNLELLRFINKLMLNFEKLISISAFTANNYIYMIVILLYNIDLIIKLKTKVHQTLITGNQNESINNLNIEHFMNCNQLYSLSFIIMFKMTSKLSDLIVESNQNSKQDDGNKLLQKSINLIPITICCDYLQSLGRDYLNFSCGEISMNNDSNDEIISKIKNEESMSRQAFYASIISLYNNSIDYLSLAEKESQSISNGTNGMKKFNRGNFSGQRSALLEEYKLQGFTPLSNIYNNILFKNNLISGDLLIQSFRIKKLKKFIFYVSNLYSAEKRFIYIIKKSQKASLSPDDEEEDDLMENLEDDDDDDDDDVIVFKPSFSLAGSSNVASSFAVPPMLPDEQNQSMEWNKSNDKVYLPTDSSNQNGMGGELVNGTASSNATVGSGSSPLSSYANPMSATNNPFNLSFPFVAGNSNQFDLFSSAATLLSPESSPTPEGFGSIGSSWNNEAAINEADDITKKANYQQQWAQAAAPTSSRVPPGFENFSNS